MKMRYLLISFLTIGSFVLGSCKETKTVVPDVSIPATYSCPEGNLTQLKAVIAVTLSEPADQQVSMYWSTSDGSALAGEDYIAVNKSVLTFAAGETTKNIEILLTNDTVFETDEIFYVTLSNIKNANVANYRTSVTITNDDTFNPVISLASSTKVTEGTASQVIAKVTATLSPASDKPVTLKWSTLDGSAKSGADYVAVSGASVVFAPGETQKLLEVPLVNDSDLEFDDSFFIVVDEVTNGTHSNSECKVTILNDDSYTPGTALDGVITPDNYPGMRLVWSDEFNEASINKEWWTFEIGGGGWGNNELEIYTNSPQNAFTSNGKLNIVATKSIDSIYNSARMITSGKKEFTYGRIDIRAKLPYGQGIWPAIWMLGSNIYQVGWPICGEIDIMEYLGHQVSKVYGTVHYNDNGHQYKGGNYTLPNGEGFDEKFHVFSIIWQENSITWYVDYQKYYEVTASTIQFDAFRLPQFFILNVAVGGSWPGYPNASTVFPQTMQVDYVRVFQPS